MAQVSGKNTLAITDSEHYDAVSPEDINIPAVEPDAGEVVSLLDFGAVADANFYDDVTELWYVDAGFTQEATDNRAIIERALNTNKKVIVPEGNYMIKGHPTNRHAIEVYGTYMNLTGVGEVNLLFPPFEPDHAKTGTPVRTASYKVFKAECDINYFHNLNFISKNVYHPFNESYPNNTAPGLTSNLQGITTENSSNIYITNVNCNGMLSMFHKSHPFTMTENYVMRDCVWEDTAIGIYAQRCSNVLLDNVKITTNDVVDENGFTIDELMHCTYYGADVYKSKFINCDFEVKSNQTGDVCKFAFNPNDYDYSNAKIEDVQFVNCSFKTNSREMFEMTLVHNFLATNCTFIMHETEAYHKKVIIFTNHASENIKFSNCYFKFDRIQKMFVRLDDVPESPPFPATEFKTPVVVDGCTIEISELDLEHTNVVAYNDINMIFNNCVIRSFHTSGNLIFFRGQGGGPSKPYIKIKGCTVESVNAWVSPFTAQAADTHFIVSDSDFINPDDTSGYDVFSAIQTDMRFISMNNRFYGARRYDGNDIQDYLDVHVQGDTFISAVSGREFSKKRDISLYSTDYTLGGQDSMATLFNFGGTPDGPRTITIPRSEKEYFIRNNSGQTLTFTTGGGTTVAVPTATNVKLYCDNANVYEF